MDDQNNPHSLFGALNRFIQNVKDFPTQDHRPLEEQFNQPQVQAPGDRPDAGQLDQPQHQVSNLSSLGLLRSLQQNRSSGRIQEASGDQQQSHQRQSVSDPASIHRLFNQPPSQDGQRQQQQPIPSQSPDPVRQLKRSHSPAPERRKKKKSSAKLSAQGKQSLEARKQQESSPLEYHRHQIPAQVRRPNRPSGIPESSSEQQQVQDQDPAPAAQSVVERYNLQIDLGFKMLLEESFGRQRSKQSSVQDSQPAGLSLNRPQVLDIQPLDQPLDLSLKRRKTQQSAPDLLRIKTKAAPEHHQPNPRPSSSRVVPLVGSGRQWSNEQPHDDFIGQLLAQLTYQQLLDLNQMNQQTIDKFRELLRALIEARKQPNKNDPGYIAAHLPEAREFIEQICQASSQRGEPTQQPADQATSRVVAIDPSKDSSSSDYVKASTEQLEGASKRDLVLVHDQSATFNNRWTPTELVDYQTVRFWRAGPILLDVLNLRRVKIYDFDSRSLHNLLQALSNTEGINLLELQIGGLRPPQILNAVYRFASLQTLSIDSFKIARDKKEQAARGVYTFEVPKLNHFFVGELLNQLNSVQWTPTSPFHFLVTISCDPLSLTRSPLLLLPIATDFGINWVKLSESTPFLVVATRLPDKAFLKNLLVLVLNQIPDLSLLAKIAGGKWWFSLVHLYINAKKLECTSFKIDQLKHLMLIYDRLAELSKQKQLGPHLNVYIHGVRLDLTRPFADYHFDKSLIKQHTENRKSGLTVQPCYSVSSTNFADVPENYKLPENPDEATQRYDRFHELYPNVQVVKLIGSVGQHPTADLFLDFLRTCNGLTELEINSSKPVDVDFYRGLANVESCRSTLRILKIATGAHHVDLTKVLLESCLPSFSFLRQFETNLATYENMLELLRHGLTDGKNFIFNFERELGFCPHFYDISRISVTHYQVRCGLRSGRRPCYLDIFSSLDAMLEGVRDQMDPQKSSLAPPPPPPRKRQKNAATADRSV